MDQPELYWDPFDESIDTDPYAIWRRLRDEQPVYRNERYDFWAISRHADVEAAHRDPETFSSAHGTVLEMMSESARSTGMMIFMDPPEHTRLRALVSRAFTPRRVAGLEAHVRALCAEMLDPHVGTSGFDFLQDFGALLPSKVISALVGVPPEDQETYRKVIDDLFHIEPGVGMVNHTSATASLQLVQYLAGLLEERSANPEDDLLSALVGAEVTDDDGAVRRLTNAESAAFALLLFTAGTETVARLLGWAAVILADHPESRDELVADPSLIPKAAEELLRLEAPSPVQGRWTTREITLHGVEIPRGSKVLLLTGSAGRDERAYTDPDRFDLHRDAASHVSFGYGIHFCVGAALARLEARVALEEVLARFPTWRVDHENVERLHTSTVRGFARVPVLI